MPDIKGRLTHQETAFIEAMVRCADPVFSAKEAGYAHPAPAASKLVRRPDIAAAIRDAVVVKIHTEGVPIAANTLMDIAKDEKAPKNSRIAAARTLCEMTSLGGIAGDGQDKPLSEMTRAELSAAKDRALAYLADLERPVIEGTAIEVRSEPAGGLFD